MINQDHKVALITGASARIGKALAESFHNRGYSILIHYNQSEAAAIALRDAFNEKRANSASIIQADLNNDIDVQELVRKTKHITKRLDLLINNASVFEPDQPENTLHQWQLTLNTNAKASLYLSMEFAHLLRAANGIIINLVDIYADRPLKRHSIYSASKAAIKMLTKSLSVELAPEVRVNGISPGAILWPDTPMPDEAKKAILEKVPLRRIGSTDAICQTAFYFVSCDYVTGQVINVDGGRSNTL